MLNKREAEVLVAGAGPVGLLTALELARQGVDVVIADKNQRTHLHSYGLALHAGTLRLLEEAGLAAELIESGQRIERVVFLQGDEQLGEVDLTKLPGPYPFVLVLPQSDLEWMLERRLADARIKVLWNHEISDLELRPTAAVARIDRYSRMSCGYPIASAEWVLEKTYSLRTALVVGADGYDSVVRERIGADYQELGEPEFFSVYEFYGLTGAEHEMRVVFSEHGLNVLWPLPGGRYRWSFQIDGADQHLPTRERLLKLAAARAPWFRPDNLDVSWSSMVRFEPRLASRFGQGPAWLAGDAAHLTGPIGVQSMNIGLREAHDLATALRRVLRQEAPAAALEDYNRQREAEWRRLLGLGPTLKVGADAPAWIHRHQVDIPQCLPAAGEDLARLLGQLGLKEA